MNNLLTMAELCDTESIEDAILGQVRQVRAEDFSGAGPNRASLSGVLCTVQAVKNRHSAVLAAGEIVLHNTDAEGPGEAVEGPSSGAAIAAGVVPWCIATAGVPVAGNFWLIKSGYCKFLSDGGNDVAAGAAVQPAASGQASLHTNGTTDIYACGILKDALGAVADALIPGFADFNQYTH